MDILIKEKERAICSVINATNKDDRGLLLLEVADQLALDSQGFTAELFRIIGTRYGLPSKGLNDGYTTQDNGDRHGPQNENCTGANSGVDSIS